MLEKIVAPKETREIRIAKCRACPDLKGILALRCGKCGCVLKAKVALAFEKCPAGKW